ncbi:uncharacterized protein LOC133819759 [Humulus lupulus]|uniref:uncharacterized protein LOC133819759 n=1 Tax=Humulus lupulus TaxID=3486 RepID=UPI002B417629|nr:uncharacterized protein LOC133819759 [Humulus lupulus]
MNGEFSDTSDQYFCQGRANVGSGERAAVNRNANNISIQTGEEFSAEFMQDPATLRRLTPVNTNVNQRSSRRVGFNLNTTNHEPVYEDRVNIFDPRRMDPDYNSEALDFGSSPGYMAELDHKVYPNNLSRYHWEYGAAGKGSSGNVGDDLNRDRIAAGPNTPHYYAESPQSYHMYVPGFCEAPKSGKVKFLCSFGGRIIHRPNDGKLRYVGGDTRILSIRKNMTWEELVKKTSAICNQPHTIKYKLPGEDMDSLISVCSDEDLHNLFEEYQEQERNGCSQRLRIFLVSLNETESPGSAEARAMQPTGSDYHQYVIAVNSMLDPSPRKSSSGQSLASQSSQFGNNSDYSPSCCRGSPTAAYAVENKECNSPNSSNLVGFFGRPVSHFSPKLPPSKSYNHLPSMSHFPVQHLEPENSNLHYYMDQPYNVGNGEGTNPFVTGKFSCQDSNYVDANDYYYNGPSQMNFHGYNKYMVDSEQPSGPQQMGFHQRSRSGDYDFSAMNVQSGMKSWRPVMKEGDFCCDKYISYPEDPLGLLPATNGKDGSRNKIMHALSDSKLQELHQRSSEGVFTLPLLNIEREKLHLASGSSKDSPTQQDKIANNLPQVDEYEIQLSARAPHCYNGREHEEILNWTNTNKALDDHLRREIGENVEVSTYTKTAEVNDSPETNCVQVLEGLVSPSPVTSMEFSADTTRQPSNQVQFCPTIKRISSQPVLDGIHELLPVASNELGGTESFFQSTKSDSLFYSDNEVSRLDKDQLNCTDHEIGKSSFSREFNEMTRFDDAVSARSFETDHDNEARKSTTVVIEDVTHGIPHDIPSSSNTLLYVEDEATDECKSIQDGEVESMVSDGEDEDGSDTDRNDSMSDATIAEIEAGVYGLQIIKYSDLEEQRELGSGTFGTVYHGKWRGTDVAIKRIKKSCFSGRSSEQERLIKDFWREARILSTLHHPNVVAFYGVVPDGPGGTLATVTEFMVNGSLRHVLLKKERVLDRRKRLRIIMDAAFGMEYLHLKNIVHFDLKCDNLLVNLRDPERPVCKVGDFGLSRIKRNTLVSGGVRGTLPWMAPELLNGSSSRVSEKVDVFSFGIVMWEILTGEEPYADMHCGAIIGGIVNNTLRPAIPKRCDSEWKRLMEECWSADPAARPSFTDITERLRDMSTSLQKNKRQEPSTRRVLESSCK